MVEPPRVGAGNAGSGELVTGNYTGRIESRQRSGLRRAFEIEVFWIVTQTGNNRFDDLS
jgi:hypothetical protein